MQQNAMPSVGVCHAHNFASCASHVLIPDIHVLLLLTMFLLQQNDSCYLIE